MAQILLDRVLFLQRLLILFLGLGTLVKKCMFTPAINGKIISKLNPYICAMGSIEIIFLPGVINGIVSIAN